MLPQTTELGESLDRSSGLPSLFAEALPRDYALWDKTYQGSIRLTQKIEKTMSLPDLRIGRYVFCLYSR